MTKLSLRTDAELLSMVLGPEATPSAVAPFSIESLARIDAEELMHLWSVDEDRLAACLAGYELGRRSLIPRSRSTFCRSPTEVFSYAAPLIGSLRKEHFMVLCLDARKKVLRHVMVASGSVDHCEVDPREVFAPAVVYRSSALILVHNHPSGDPEPSTEDVELTHLLVRAAASLSMPVIDHVVVSQSGYVSMKQRGLIRSVPSPKGQSEMGADPNATIHRVH